MPTPKKRQEGPVFRRKEDQLKFDITNKVIGVVKWLIMANLVLLYFFYSVANDNKELTEYQMRIISELNKKVDDKLFDKDQSREERRITAILNKCSACHDLSDDKKLIPFEWRFEEFRDYLRGKQRVPLNNIMPNFTKDEIHEKEVETLFFKLKVN